MNYNCSNLLDMRNLQEQVKKAFSYQKLFWPFTVWISCFSDLKNFESSRPSVSNFKSFSRLLEQLFLTVGQNNFGNKIPSVTRTNIQSYLFWSAQYGFSFKNQNRQLKANLQLFENEQTHFREKIAVSVFDLMNKL